MGDTQTNCIGFFSRAGGYNLTAPDEAAKGRGPEKEQKQVEIEERDPYVKREGIVGKLDAPLYNKKSKRPQTHFSKQ